MVGCVFSKMHNCLVQSRPVSVQIVWCKADLECTDCLL